MKRHKTLAALLVLALLLCPATAGVARAEDPPDPPEPVMPPGMVVGTGTHFEVTDSEYLNVTLDSSEPITLSLVSVPNDVILGIEPVADAPPTQITVGGLAPSATYYMYQDDDTSYVLVTTDADGRCTFTLDLSEQHLILIRDRPATKYIRDDSTGGHCQAIGGTWDWPTKTCTLGADVHDQIWIADHDITLDGAGHLVRGTGTGTGIMVKKLDGVTLKNLRVENFYYGLYIWTSSPTVTRCTITGNTEGIHNRFYASPTVTHNTIVGKPGVVSYGIMNDSHASPIVTHNVITGHSRWASVGIYSYGHSHTIIANNVIRGNHHGVFSRYHGRPTIVNNTIVGNSQTGIYNWDTSSRIANNIVSNNRWGIYVKLDYLPTLNNNDVWGNWRNYGGAAPGAGDISQDPLFVDPSSYDYHLQWGSPCIDSGTGAVPGVPIVDFDGKPRPVDGDGDGTAAFDMGAFEFQLNAPPTADAGGPYTADEGETFTLDASGSSDPDDNIVLYEWDLDNDGEYDDATGVTTPVVFDDNGAFVVAVKVTDDHGEYDTASAEVTIYNVAPTVGKITAPVDPVAVGTPITASASFTDPGILDTHTAVWDWGDVTTPGTVTEADGSGSVTDDHTYTVPGVYTITLTVTDDDGGAGSEVYQYVVVYDPEGGFVTGGGWIDSPEGAYAPDPSLTGKATFGFVSKYKKGATVPTGQTEFQFRVADLNFHSTSYDWLVIAGAKAQYKGSGTINGEGDYGFMLTAIDEKLTPSTDVDMFRIKIWDKGTDSVVYDNKAGEPDSSDLATVLGGGSIVIHKK